jgi:hypothetical protein
MTSPNDAAERGRGSLGADLPSIDVPDDLHRRVRAALGSRSIVRRSRFRLGTIAAAVGLLAAGFLLGAVARGRPSAAERVAATTGQYVVLLYGDTPGDTGVVHAAREREYGRWASTLGDGVRWVGGSELHDVVAQLGAPVTDAAADKLAGYFILEASSREQATAAAETCPHLKYGGRVVVMTIAS